jgi:hypothetical protein
VTELNSDKNNYLNETAFQKIFLRLGASYIKQKEGIFDPGK